MGTVKRVSEDHIVIEWDGVFGDWHYTDKQAKEIEVIDESR